MKFDTDFSLPSNILSENFNEKGQKILELITDKSTKLTSVRHRILQLADLSEHKMEDQEFLREKINNPISAVNTSAVMVGIRQALSQRIQEYLQIRNSLFGYVESGVLCLLADSIKGNTSFPDGVSIHATCLSRIKFPPYYYTIQTPALFYDQQNEYGLKIGIVEPFQDKFKFSSKNTDLVLTSKSKISPDAISARVEKLTQSVKICSHLAIISGYNHESKPAEITSLTRLLYGFD